MSNKHTATLPDGSIAKRTSENKTYSHCVAYRVPQAVRVERHLRDADYLGFQAERHEAVASGAKPLPADAIKWGWTVEKYANWATDLRSREAGFRAEAAAVDSDGPWKVAGWQSRYDLAVKAQARETKFGHETVILTVEVK